MNQGKTSQFFIGKEFAIQILFVLSGILIPFIFPLYIGLEEYGLFVKNTAFVFLFQRVIDISSEQFLTLKNRTKESKFASLLVHYFLFIVIFYVTSKIFSLDSNNLVAFSLFASSFGVNALFLFESKNAIITYLSSFILILIFSLVFRNELGIKSPEELIVFANLFGFFLVLVYIVRLKWTGQSELFSQNGFFQNLDFSLVSGISYSFFNVSLGFILPFVLSFKLNNEFLGSVKLTLSIIFAALYLFPINQKRLITFFSDKEKEKENTATINKYIAFHSYLTILVVLIYFGLYFSNIFPFANLYASSFALACLFTPIFILEKYVLAKREKRYLYIFNLAFGFLLIISCFYWIDNQNEFFLMLSVNLLVMYLTHFLYNREFSWSKIYLHLLSLLLIILFFLYVISST